MYRSDAIFNKIPEKVMASPTRLIIFHSRMPTPDLPRYQDCHELWSKKRRRQQREQESLAAAARGGTGSNLAANTGDSSNPSVTTTNIKADGSGSLSGGILSNLPTSRSTSQPGSEKLDDNSLQG